MSTPTVEATAQAVNPPLTAHDRCDRCGAQAKSRAIFASGELLFCGHHTTEYAAKLSTQAVLVLSQ
jgi:hypothetical protein